MKEVWVEFKFTIHRAFFNLYSLYHNDLICGILLKEIS